MNFSSLNLKVLVLWFVLVLFSCFQQLNAQTTKEEFKPSGKIWGYAFLDFFAKIGGDTATWASRADYSVIPKNTTAFSLRRMYLGYDYNISQVFSTSALLEGSDASLDTRGERTVFIKSLNLKWKNIFKGADLVVGQQPTLAYSIIEEKVWNYRSIEKTMLDQRGVRASSDMGIALYGRFDSLGTYGYHVLFSNGAGPRPEEITGPEKYKLYSADLFCYILDRKVIITLYGELHQGPPHLDFVAVKTFVGYQTEPVTLGVEVFSQSQHHVKSDLTNATPFGVSVFARDQIVKDKLSAFARYDTFNPDDSFREQDALTVYNPAKMHLNYDEQFITAGLDYTPNKNVHIMPNIWYNSYKAKAASDLLVDRKADVVTRVTFYFVFK